MSITRMISRLTLLMALLALVSIPALAQDDSGGDVGAGNAETDAPFFNDNRINNRIILGEFGLYCTDAQGQTANTYQNGGGIAVWGATGQQYLFVPEAQITFLSDPANLGMSMQGATTQTFGSAESMMTQQGQTSGGTQGTMMGSANQNRINNNQGLMPGEFPILLGRANAANGPVQIYLTGPNTFQLNAFLPDGKGFAYNWAGCSGTTGVQTFTGVTLDNSAQDTDMQNTTGTTGTQNNTNQQNGTGTGS